MHSSTSRRRLITKLWQAVCSTRTQKWRTATYRHFISSMKIIGEKVMHKDNKAKGPCILPISRRRFVQGLAAGGAVTALDWGGLRAFGETDQQQTPATLTGKNFELTIDSLPVNFTGRHSIATAVNGSVPGPILRWREGDTVTLAVTNRLKIPTSIHWHAIRLPADMDGVPGLSFPGIAPQDVPLPHTGGAERYLLVSQPQPVSGADGTGWCPNCRA